MQKERHKIHFTCPKGWCNDPNGLIFIDGTYHLFYQHYPYDTKWGPMHWGHAVSDDLLTWENLDIALYPSENDWCFSGCSVLDKENVSSLGTAEKPALLLFYTNHNSKNGEQNQHLAFSTDYIHFEKYNKNPVIKNNFGTSGFKKDFRDPKIIKFDDTSYIMVLSAGKKIEFYTSSNLTDWKENGSFYPGEYGIEGICECPDLIRFNTEDGVKFVLSMSMIHSGTEEKSMQYFTGFFDGKNFVADIRDDYPLMLDYGEDNYAAVTFSGTEEPVMIGWGENWEKAKANNAEVWFGKMTLARKLSLKKAGDLYHLVQKPVVQINKNSESLWQKKFQLNAGDSFSRSGICISNTEDELVINDKRIKRILRGACNIHVIFDTGFIEVFADDGMISYSQNLTDSEKQNS